MLAPKSADCLLSRQRARSRFHAERLACHCPLAISLLEILEQNVGAFGLRSGFLRQFFRRTLQHRVFTVPNKAITPLSHFGLAVAQAHGVFQPAGQFHRCRFRARIPDGEAQNRSRQRRILYIEGDKRGKRGHGNGYGQFFGAIIYRRHRVLPLKRNVVSGKAPAVQLPHLGFVANRHFEGKSLFDGRFGVGAGGRSSDRPNRKSCRAAAG